jgi:hypothetical protein
LGASPVAKHKIYYKGGRWWLPPSSSCGESCEFVFARGSFVHQKCSSYALTNLLFGLCRSMWVIELFVNLLNPYPEIPSRPSTTKVQWVKKRTPVPSLFVVFTFGLALNPSRSLGVHQRPSTFEVLQVREHAPTPYPFLVFIFRLVVEFGGVCHLVFLLPLLSLEIIEIGSKSCCMANLKFVFHFLVPWLEFVYDLSFIHSFACLCWVCMDLIVNLILQLVV